jgi:hypothetical protein
MPTTFVRALRQPLTWLVIAAFALLAMLALESAGKSHAPSAVPLSIVSKDKGGDGDNGGGSDKHCKDGKGKDGEHNKHCRGTSGGQGGGGDEGGGGGDEGGGGGDEGGHGHGHG